MPMLVSGLIRSEKALRETSLKSKTDTRSGKNNPLNRVILFGGTSEIGLEIANQAKLHCGDTAGQIVTRILRPNLTERQPGLYRDVVWEPRTWIDVLSVVQRVPIGPGDLAIISIGDLSLDDSSSDQLASSLQQVDANVFVNGTLPTLTLLAVAQEMLKAGGGCVVIVSSVAAFPVMDSNAIYGASKRLLDDIAFSLIRDFRKKNIRLIIARPGFVNTKLHKKRASSLLSTSSRAIAQSTVRKVLSNSSGVIWIPGVWRQLSWILSSFPFARRAASMVLRKLKRT